MEVRFNDHFYKDLKLIDNQKTSNKLIIIIDEVKQAKILKDVRNVIKMKGHQTAYRIRLGEYRVGIFLENNVVEFTRFMHRKDIYNYFP